MITIIRIVYMVLICFWVSSATAGRDFIGIIESRPVEKGGTWVIGGRSFEVTERTELDEGNGPLKVGACAEVEMRGEFVREIDRVSKRRCRK